MAGKSWRDNLHWLNFSYDDEIEIRKWVNNTSPDWSSCLAELVDSEWSVRITPPTRGDDYTVSCTYKGKRAELKDQTYIASYPDFEGSVLIAYWAITILLEDRGALKTNELTTRAWLET